jgi:hypothetical protein
LDISEVATTLFGSNGWSLSHPAIEIRDLSGVLLFQDYQLRSTLGKEAWLRFFAPQPEFPLVSAEEGLHPTLKNTGNAIEFKKRFSSEKYTSNLDGYPALYCYHYPNLAIIISRADKQVFVDIVDGKEFEITESGTNQASSEENRIPYSFLSQISEAGAPGEFTVPIPEYEIPGKLHGQIHDNWCAAASCQMVLEGLGIVVTQEEIARLMEIPEDPKQGGASIDDQMKAFFALLPGGMTATLDLDPLGNECISSLLKDRPLKLGIWRHAQAIFGWTSIADAVLYKIYDPLPVGVGSIKYQNPHIVWSMNYITVEPKGK